MDPIGKKLLDIAKGELGYTEKSDGYTKFGDWYAKNVDKDHDTYFKTAPWCDMFLAWAADKAGVSASVGQFAATVDHAKWFKQQGAWGDKPEPGAIVFFSWSGSKDLDDIDHVGIVRSVDGDTVHTYEANVEGVHLKEKTRDGSSIVGFGYPGKTKAAAAPKPKAPAPGEQKYAPKHAAPAPSAQALTNAAPGEHGVAKTHENTSSGHEVINTQDAILGGLVAVAVVGTVALAVGKSAAAKMPTAPPVRVRKRGKHHRTPVPVALPADVTPAHLDEAEASTAMMPAISAAVAAEAEDREFWGKIEHLKEDQELAFWDSLHAELTVSPRQAPASGHQVPTAF